MVDCAHTLNFLAAMQPSGPVQLLPGLAAAHLLHVRRASMSYEVMTTCVSGVHQNLHRSNLQLLNKCLFHRGLAYLSTQRLHVKSSHRLRDCAATGSSVLLQIANLAALSASHLKEAIISEIQRAQMQPQGKR